MSDKGKEIEAEVSEEIAHFIENWSDHEDKDPEEIAGMVIERAINDWRDSEPDMEPLETVQHHDRSKEELTGEE